MESEIRLILLVIGALIILAILWDGLRRQKRQKKTHRKGLTPNVSETLERTPEEDQTQHQVETEVETSVEERHDHIVMHEAPDPDFEDDDRDEYDDYDDEDYNDDHDQEDKEACAEYEEDGDWADNENEHEHQVETEFVEPRVEEDIDQPVSELEVIAEETEASQDLANREYQRKKEIEEFIDLHIEKLSEKVKESGMQYTDSPDDLEQAEALLEDEAEPEVAQAEETESSPSYYFQSGGHASLTSVQFNSEPMSLFKSDEPEAEPVPEPVAEPQPKPVAEPIGNLVMVSLLAPEEKTFGGFNLLQAVLNEGFRFGDMQIFHYHEQGEETGKVLFSLAAATESGGFDLSRMASFTCKGLVMFMYAKDHDHPVEVFDEMLAVAEDLADELGAELKLGQSDEYTEDGIDKIRDGLAAVSE